ncbi:hypothetical protein GCM10010297_27480 [Streptomyces malachitofuscus]|nr:hypothetical protein GCM10010297_27480 [Streptomyces malachitofuscus]
MPAPRFIAWWVWSAVGFGGLVAALWWAGGDHPGWQREGFFGVVGFAGRVFGGLGAVFRISGDKGASIGARLAFLLTLLLLLYVLWRATRAWLAYKPGPVDVQQLEDATQEGTVKPSDVDLTARLRRHLSDSTMYPPTTLPAQAPVESFLELLGDVELDPDKLGSALPKVLSRLRPKLAYRVSGILQSRDTGPERFGITITVTAFLFGSSRVMTIWGMDWDEVIRKASIWVVSTLLPVTRAGRLPPWRAWWGRELKPELYQAYQAATDLSRTGRHHEALEQYFTAVELDPANPYLRAELAEMQEKMGLHIDALDTYQRSLTLDGQTTRGYYKRLWRRRWNPHPSRLRYLRHPRKYREVLGVRYRNSITLGTPEVLAKQWYERTGTHGDRTHEELIPILVERYWPAAVGLDASGSREGEAQAKERLRSLLTEKRTDAHAHLHGAQEEREIRLIFQRASMQETKRLTADDRWARALLYWPSSLWSATRAAWPAAYLQPYRGTHQPVTRGAFLTNLNIWAPLRLAWASSEYDREQSPYRWQRPYTWHWRRGIDWNRLRMSDIDRRLTWARRWPPWRRDWLAHYNAACAYAIAMNCPGQPERARRRRRQLAERAIEHLEKAVVSPRKQFVTVEREWMADEDPDLEELREEKEVFADFLRTAYPGVETTPARPAMSFAAEQMREYDYRLLTAVAKIMEQVWRDRCSGPGTDTHTAASWLRAESEIWESLHEIVDNQRVHKWQDRVDLIHRVQTHYHSVASHTPGFPPEVGLDNTAQTGLDINLQRIERKFGQLRRDMEPPRPDSDSFSPDAPFPNHTPYSNSQESRRALRDAEADGLAWLNANTVRKLSVRYAATWQRLGDWLELSESREPFGRAVENVPQLTRRAVPRVDGRRMSI